MINRLYRVKAAAGWLSAAGKVVQLLRREGIFGLRCRLALDKELFSWANSKRIGHYDILNDEVRAKMRHTVESDVGLTVGLRFAG